MRRPARHWLPTGCALVVTTVLGVRILLGALSAEIPPASERARSADTSWLGEQLPPTEARRASWAVWTPRSRSWGQSPFLNAAEAERFGDEAAYLADTRRGSDAPASVEPHLSAILHVRGRASAVVSGESGAVGDVVAGLEILEIVEGRVRVRDATGDRWLRLAAIDEHRDKEVQ